jgi:ubiquinone/menaquinone biosynthesis C-methylase UbiE
MDTYLKFGTLPIEPYIEYIISKAESIPIADNSCCRVYSTNVIDHVEHPDKVLEECRRIVKTTGEVFFAVHTINFPFSLLGPILFVVDKIHPHHFSKRYVMRLARRHFRNVTLTRKITIFEDHPEFTLANTFLSPDKLRGLKRWLSTFLISTCYLKCSN